MCAVEHSYVLNGNGKITILLESQAARNALQNLSSTTTLTFTSTVSSSTLATLAEYGGFTSLQAPKTQRHSSGSIHSLTFADSVDIQVVSEGDNQCH